MMNYVIWVAQGEWQQQRDGHLLSHRGRNIPISSFVASWNSC